MKPRRNPYLLGAGSVLMLLYPIVELGYLWMRRSQQLIGLPINVTFAFAFLSLIAFPVGFGLIVAGSKRHRD